MIRVRPRMARFCMSPSTVRVRTRSSPSTQQRQKHKRSYSSIQVDEQASSEFSSKNSTGMSQEGEGKGEGEGEAEKLCGNRVMVVIDSSIEAKAALHWALSHTIQSQDTVILLYVVTRPSSVQGGKNIDQRAYKLLSSMKNLCQAHKPGVQVEILVREGKEKGSTIVQEAKHGKVSLLVLGKRKRSIMWLVQKMWAGKRRIRSSTCSATDYCVQNAKCMTVAVRKKGRNHGGYLITTKRHKDFWLLA